MTKRKQDTADLRAYLQEQVGFLRKRGAGFDEGDDSEAKQLATTIRVLVHNTGTSHALLTQLHKLDRMRFVDTSHPPLQPGEYRIDSGLAVISMGDETRYRAPLSDRPQRTPRRFSPWWKEPVVTDEHGGAFNRRDLVLGPAHKEGGAHVDPELDEAYASLTRSNSLGWQFGLPEGTTIDAGSPVPANVRQIAWELETTIVSEFNALFPGATIPPNIPPRRDAEGAAGPHGRD